MEEMTPFVPWVRLVRQFPTLLLIEELERREREDPGIWTGEQARRIQELSEKINRPPIRGA